MKRLVITLQILISVTITSAQFTIDGDFSEIDYQLLAAKQNSNSGFGPNQDLTNVYYGVDGANLYLGFEGMVQNTFNPYNPKPDGIGVFLNFTTETGLTAGNSLGIDTNIDFHFLNGNNAENAQGYTDHRIDFKADFEVDYLLAFYSDGTDNIIICDAVTHVAGNVQSIQNIGTSDQAGTAVSGPTVDGVFSADSIIFAFQNSTGSGSKKGAEIKIPFSEFNGNPNDEFQVFAGIVSSTAYFSDMTIPGDVTSGNLGYEPDYNSNLISSNCECSSPGNMIGNGPYHTELTIIEPQVPNPPQQLEALPYEDYILLRWSSNEEANIFQYNVYRDTDSLATTLYDSIDATDFSILFYTDSNVVINQTYYYRVTAVNVVGYESDFSDETYAASTGYVKIESELTVVPDEFILYQNYPNPFNPVTTLRYDLPENSFVRITIYDLLGREVKTLVNQTQNAGYQSVIWDATNDQRQPVTAGVYLCQVRARLRSSNYDGQAGEFVQTRKMVLLK